MASLYDDPRLTQSVQGARRDWGLLNRAYRDARRRGRFGEALKYAQQGDAMGLPVGGPTNDRDLEGAGRVRYLAGLRASGQREPATGLDAFDFRQAKDRGEAGVGGYDFRQRKDVERDALRPPPLPSDDPNDAGGVPGQGGPSMPPSTTGIPQQTPSLMKRYVPRSPIPGLSNGSATAAPPQVAGNLKENTRAAEEDMSAIRGRLARTGTAFLPGESGAGNAATATPVGANPLHDRNSPEFRRLSDSYRGLANRRPINAPAPYDARVEAAHAASLDADAKFADASRATGEYYRARGTTAEESLDPVRVKSYLTDRLAEVRRLDRALDRRVEDDFKRIDADNRSIEGSVIAPQTTLGRENMRRATTLMGRRRNRY